MKKKRKVLVLCDAVEPTPPDHDLAVYLAGDRKTEADVLAAFSELGHSTDHLVIFDELELLRQKLQAFQPDIIFNLADQFRNNRAWDQNIVSFLEMHGFPFTGCGSTGLTLCKNKAISKKILGYHRIRVPQFTVIPRGRRGVRPRQLKFPILIKPLKEEASYGIAQASFVETDEQFRERVAFIHDSHNNDAIAEEYIGGRELYVSILGAKRLEAFPVRELVFREVPPTSPGLPLTGASGMRNTGSAGVWRINLPRTCPQTLFRILCKPASASITS
jgi:D-alanine-D-alanine ligase